MTHIYSKNQPFFTLRITVALLIRRLLDIDAV
ncbi:hypothetical protein PDE_01244 [Penicillium oxalicum 114-2]|uniref:Uncharacterized protein n=1 Tax=Penicillium oxalicum (strain 114-2 / CGMCC 5302) TaxID=933388 RepID=S8AKG7_PENO1|nr:hypothetical protein PDE_01244 [Penicillium oxalicum 114-2]